MALMSSIFVECWTPDGALSTKYLNLGCCKLFSVQSFKIILPIWGDQELSAETKTPRSLTVSLGLMKLSFAVE